jgi:hypothetical protein
MVSFLPEWESLPEACDRIIDSGFSRQQAQADICRAITDQKIGVRTPAELVTTTVHDHLINHRFAKEYARYTRQLREGTIVIDIRGVKPSSLSWDLSRFKDQPLLQPGMKGYPGPPRNWIVSIEVYSADITRLFCDSSIGALPIDGRKYSLADRQIVTQIKMILETNRNAKKEEVRTALAKNFDFTERHFHSHLWPEGRELANLGRKAPPGRKPKSST